MHVSVLGNPDDSVIVTVRGDLGADSAAVLSTTLDQVLARPVPRIVVDLSGADSCDAIALTAFAAGHERAAAAGGWVRLAAPHETLTHMLNTAPPHRLRIYPGVADALAD